MPMPRIYFQSKDTLKGPSMSSSTAVRNKQAERDEINEQIARYLERGGKIKTVSTEGAK